MTTSATTIELFAARNLHCAVALAEEATYLLLISMLGTHAVVIMDADLGERLLASMRGNPTDTVIDIYHDWANEAGKDIIWDAVSANTPIYIGADRVLVGPITTEDLED